MGVNILQGSRNTSTDVEKTRIGSERSEKGWKHLHGRGEDLWSRPRN